MKRLVVLLGISLVLVSCATVRSGGGALVGRGLQAVGGAETLGGVRMLATRGTVRQWEPEQSMTAGGEMRFACESAFEAVTDVAAGATRIDWSRKFAYPAPRSFTFTEVVTPGAGYVAGIDSNGRTRQSLDAKPPAHAMSGLRLAATHRELRRTSPLLLLDMHRHPERVTAAGDVMIGGTAHPAVHYRTGDQTLTVLFDAGTGLPLRVRSLDYDNIWGDVTYDLVLSDWQTFEGVRMATTQRYELNGRVVAETKVTSAKVNGAMASDSLAIPDAFRTGASKPATGAVPFQWVIRRQFIGTYLDSDVPSYDSRGATGLRLVELAPGVQHAVGGSHHSLVVEMKDHLVVFDAPVSDWQSNWLLGAAKAKYPGKPVKFLVLTHHHMDHAGGLRGILAEGGMLVVGQGAGAHFRRVLSAPMTRNPDLPARSFHMTPILEVPESHVMSDSAGRQVIVYVMDNPHAKGMLMGWVPHAKLGFVTDIWTPGPPLPAKPNPGLASVVNTVKRAGLEPERFAGGHGTVADYQGLVKLVGQ